MSDPYTAKSAQDVSPSQKLKEVKGIMKTAKCEQPHFNSIVFNIF